METHKSRVSIGMPVYNGEKFISVSIDSILTQSFDNFELIISDNASTDRTEEICRTYLNRDKRIRYIRNDTNIGVNRNFNRVFALCTGEYFKWASADDVCGQDLLARCLEVLESNPGVVLAYPKTTFIDATGKALNWHDPGWDLRSDDALERMRYVIASGHWVNAFYGLIQVQSLVHTRLLPSYHSGDYRLLGELSLCGKFFEVPEHLFFRRIHTEASSQNTGAKWQAEFFRGGHRYTDLPLWHLYGDHAVTIYRSQLRLPQKLALLMAVLNRMRLAKRQLCTELHAALQHGLRERPLLKTNLWS